jgi:hypothetical protein
MARFPKNPGLMEKALRMQKIFRYEEKQISAYIVENFCQNILWVFIY